MVKTNFKFRRCVTVLRSLKVRAVSLLLPPFSPSLVLRLTPSPSLRLRLIAIDWQPQIQQYITELIEFAQEEDSEHLMREAESRRAKNEDVSTGQVA